MILSLLFLLLAVFDTLVSKPSSSDKPTFRPQKKKEEKKKHRLRIGIKMADVTKHTSI